MACNPLTNTELNKLDGISKKYTDYKICSFTGSGPQGPIGPTGPQGPIGPTGATGPNPEGYNFVTGLSDLPPCVGDVIQLEANETYFFIGDIDLNGCRIVGSANTCLLGPSSENAFITSTGLSAGVPLFTTEWTTPIRHVTFRNVDTGFYIDGNANPPVALDWTGVNFSNIPNIGTINTCDNWIYTKGAVLSSKNLIITGTHGTIASNESIFVGDASPGYIFNITEDANITRRFRTIYSSIVVFGGTKGIFFSPTASVPIESYILDTVNFSGGSTYLEGVDVTTNKTLFTNCKGIDNTSVNGQMYMNNNATASVISTASVFTKVLGNTLASADNEKYLHSSNRLTNDAVIERKYLIMCNLSFNSGNNNQCTFGFYDSKLGGIRAPSQTTVTANAAGRAESVSFQCIVNHSQGDYLEIWCTNNTTTTNITVTDMNVTVTQIV